MAALGASLPAIPQTFTVTAKLQIGNELERLRGAAADAAAAGRGDVWIVKPTSLNRGAGISVVRGIGAYLKCTALCCEGAAQHTRLACAHRERTTQAACFRSAGSEYARHAKLSYWRDPKGGQSVSACATRYIP